MNYRYTHGEEENVYLLLFPFGERGYQDVLKYSQVQLFIKIFFFIVSPRVCVFYEYATAFGSFLLLHLNIHTRA